MAKIEWVLSDPTPWFSWLKNHRGKGDFAEREEPTRQAQADPQEKEAEVLDR